MTSWTRPVLSCGSSYRRCGCLAFVFRALRAYPRIPTYSTSKPKHTHPNHRPDFSALMLRGIAPLAASKQLHVNESSKTAAFAPQPPPTLFLAACFSRPACLIICTTSRTSCHVPRSRVRHVFQVSTARRSAMLPRYHTVTDLQRQLYN